MPIMLKPTPTARCFIGRPANPIWRSPITTRRSQSTATTCPPFLAAVPSTANKRQSTQALADLNKAIALKPDNAQAYYQRGLLYQSQHQYQFAIDDFSTSMGLAPRKAEPHVARALSYLAISDAKSAASDLDDAVQIDPGNLQAWTSRGLAYERLGQKEKAAGSYAKALNINEKYEAGASRLCPRRRQSWAILPDVLRQQLRMQLSEAAHDDHAQSHHRPGARQRSRRQNSLPTFSASSARAATYFAPVKMNKSLTLLFDENDKFESHHLAFHVSNREFDAIFGRIKAAKIAFGSAPWSLDDGKLNDWGGGRGVYFRDPNGHVFELMTVPQ